MSLSLPAGASVGRAIDQHKGRQHIAQLRGSWYIPAVYVPLPSPYLRCNASNQSTVKLKISTRYRHRFRNLLSYVKIKRLCPCVTVTTVCEEGYRL